jgi:hypothetical protein
MDAGQLRKDGPATGKIRLVFPRGQSRIFPDGKFVVVSLVKQPDTAAKVVNNQSLVCMKVFTVKHFVIAVAVLAASRLPLPAQTVLHQTVTVQGGVPGTPVMAGISKLTNGVQIFWDGPSGNYQVFQKTNDLAAALWVALGKNTNQNRTAVITKLYSNAFFRVSGPSPKYAGYKVCLTCHQSVCRFYTNTAHLGAFVDLPDSQKQNPACIACHTVGYGLPTGFTFTNRNGVFSYSTNLAGVQCENCHGPAANHASSPDDPTIVPRVDIAATICGGCHTSPRSPTYDEWLSSGHSTVVPGALSSMTSSTNNIKNCGVCHSGIARLTLIGGKNPAITQTNDFNLAQTCAVCHDPHATNANPAQLLNPLSSTNNFSLTSSDLSTVQTFTNKYNANLNINLCAQCHNDRGAVWTDTSRAPHHSLQYNLLIGSVGDLFNGVTNVPADYNPGTHSRVSQQCVYCHMAPNSYGMNSHTFALSYSGCSSCHGNAQNSQKNLFNQLSNEVSTVIMGLNNWVAHKAPPTLLTNGAVAWEYTTPGGLAWTTNSSGYVTSWILLDDVNYKGPNSAGQAQIPDRIKQARFNLYLVLFDGSMGTHNPTFARNLLNSAESFIIEELNQ